MSGQSENDSSSDDAPNRKFDWRRALTSAVFGGVREAVGTATTKAGASISAALRTAATVLIAVGLLAVCIGVVLIAVFALALREQQRQLRRKTTGDNGQPPGIGFSTTAAVFALVGGIAWLILGVAVAVAGGQALSLAGEFGRSAAQERDGFFARAT